MGWGYEKQVDDRRTTYCFDLGGTLSSLTGGAYEKAVPFLRRNYFVNELFDAGNVIKIFTARGASSRKDWADFTKEQLDSWGVKRHQLLFGKPHADVFVDDKAVNAEVFIWQGR